MCNSWPAINSVSGSLYREFSLFSKIFIRYWIRSVLWRFNLIMSKKYLSWDFNGFIGSASVVVIKAFSRYFFLNLYKLQKINSSNNLGK